MGGLGHSALKSLAAAAAAPTCYGVLIPAPLQTASSPQVLNQDGAMTLPMPASTTVEKSADQKTCLCHDDLQSSPPPCASESERSIAFKRWARGRCYRYLARDHQVNSCRDSFRCNRCRRPGHREWEPSSLHLFYSVGQLLFDVSPSSADKELG